MGYEFWYWVEAELEREGVLFKCWSYEKVFFFVLYPMIVVFPIEGKGAVHVVANGTCPKHKLPRFKPDIATY